MSLIPSSGEMLSLEPEGTSQAWYSLHRALRLTLRGY